MVNPTQYLNAVEYAHHCGNGENHMAVMTRYSTSIYEIEKLGAGVYWKSIEALNVPMKNEIHSDKALWNLMRKFMERKLHEVEPNELIIGNIADSCMYPFAIRYQKRFSHITFLDDGTPSLYVSRKRASGEFKSEWHHRNTNFIVKSLLYNRVSLITTPPPRSLRFFSIFKFEVKEGDQRIENRYSWLKSKMSITNTLGSQVYFVGSHIVDRDLVEREVYMNALNRARVILEERGFEFHYIHHRGESKEIRKEIQDNYSCMEFELPLELAFLTQDRPQVFAGNFSSALFNLSRIYQDQEVMAFLLPKKYLNGTVHEPTEYLDSTMLALEEDELIKTRTLTNLG